MPEKLPSSPFYHRFALSLLALALIVVALYVGQDIWVPLALALLLAVLLRPVEAKLIQWGLHKVLAISIALLLAMVVLAGLTMFISMQISHFSDDFPKLKQNVNDFYNDARQWVRREYNVSYGKQEQYIKQAQEQTIQSLQGSGGGLLSTILGPLGTLTLLPIYVFLLLYYRTMLLQFAIKLFAEEHTARVREVLGEIKAVIQSYVVGLLLETASVAALNSVGLLILGVKYAVLLGVIAAILNLIPYIGGLVAIGLTLLITFMNNPEPGTLLGVLVIFLVVQFIDNNFLVPVIVGSKVKVNALVSILGVLIGGAIAGVSGMFLSIPGIAMMKIVFDRVEGMEAWGILIGDDTPDDARKPMVKVPEKMKLKVKKKEKAA